MIYSKLLGAGKTPLGDLVYLGQTVVDGTSSTSTINFSESCAANDLIVFLCALETNTPAPSDTVFSIDSSPALTEVVAPNTSYTSNSSIYSTTGADLGGGTSFTARCTTSGGGSRARWSVDAYKIEGGASVIDSATVDASNGTGESVTVHFSSGYLLGVYYTGDDEQHNWSGVTNFYEVPHPDNNLSEGSYAYNDTPTTSSHTVSTSHTSQTNSQGLQLCVVVYG